MCYTPYIIKNPNILGDRHIPVPCGKCKKCLQNRANEWHFRIRQEVASSDIQKTAFVTLTYDNQNVTITDKGYMSLNWDDVTKFMKRLRKAHYKRYGKKHRIKYYLCGEYGGKTNRPHYHAIMLNVDTDLIEDTWQLGEIHFGDVQGASIMYTLKYMVKPGRIPMHENDDRVPEKSRMSKGIGKKYLDNQEIIKWHNEDKSRFYVQDVGNRKIRLPRYYRDKIYSDEDKLRHHKRMVKKAEKAENKRYKEFKKKYGDDMDKFAYRQHMRKINAMKFDKDNNVNRDKL